MINISHTYKITDKDLQNGVSTVIDALARCMKLSSREIRRVKSKKRVRVNNQIISVNANIHAGDVISIESSEEINTYPPEPIKFSVLYEDDDLLIVDKPPFLVVHPTMGHPSGTLINAISHYQQKRTENYKIRLINRLDRDTSGIVLIAKNSHAQQIISRQIVEGLTVKKYYTIVEGNALSLIKKCNAVQLLDEKNYKVLIDAPIRRNAEQDMLRIVADDGQESQTVAEVIKANDTASLLEIQLLTGRTHQIRVHMKYIGLPIIADHLYGNKSIYIDRQALHCHYMELENLKGEKLMINAPIPRDIQNALDIIGL